MRELFGWPLGCARNIYIEIFNPARPQVFPQNLASRIKTSQMLSLQGLQSWLQESILQVAALERWTASRCIGNSDMFAGQL